MLRLIEDGRVLWEGERDIDDEILLVRWMDMLFLFDGMEGDVKTFRKVECETL